MGACYSGQASKSCPTATTQTPIDPKSRPFEYHNRSAEDANHCRQLSRSTENQSFAQHIDRKADKLQMSSQPNRQKIPIPSSKLVANHRVVPKSGADDYVLNKYQQSRRYEAAVDANQVMIFDNSSTTSISSDCSINLSKSSKSTSSSASTAGRLHGSIPKPAVTSRTPTPPIPSKYGPIARKGIQTQHKYSDKTNKLAQNQNHSSLISDRLNGNDVTRGDTKAVKTKSSISSELHSSKTNINNNNGVTGGPPTYGTSIKYTTQVSGLPRPQTAHIVSTSSQSADNHKIKAANHTDSRFRQYSGDRTQNSVRCDASQRQVKPYYYGMSTNNKPYERPNTNTNAANNSFNYNNRMQFQPQPQPPNPSKPVFSPSFNSQPINQKPKAMAPNGSLSFRPTLKPTPKRDDSSVKEISIENNNENYIKNSDKSETNEDLDCNSNENSFLPKSIQRMRELTPNFMRRDSKESGSDVKCDKTMTESGVKGDSISCVGPNSEVDNRDFLIDDEISDQPELTLASSISKKDLMKTLNSELEGLILKQESSHASLSSPTPSSPSVSLSTSSSASTVIPNKKPFRRPRPLSLVEGADGSYGLDSPSFRAASQDLIGIKTLLFRLHGLLQNAETLNPFEHNYTQNKFYNQLMIAENDDNKSGDCDDLSKENFDLKRQIVLQQQIIEDKDRTIRLLQQQMAKYSNINSAYVSPNLSAERVNASCQTDRCHNASDINPRAVSDGSNGMLVSVCCTHVPDTNT